MSVNIGRERREHVDELSISNTCGGEVCGQIGEIDRQVGKVGLGN